MKPLCGHLLQHEYLQPLRPLQATQTHATSGSAPQAARGQEGLRKCAWGDGRGCRIPEGPGAVAWGQGPARMFSSLPGHMASPQNWLEPQECGAPAWVVNTTLSGRHHPIECAETQNILPGLSRPTGFPGDPHTSRCPRGAPLEETISLHELPGAHLPCGRLARARWGSAGRWEEKARSRRQEEGMPSVPDFCSLSPGSHSFLEDAGSRKTWVTRTCWPLASNAWRPRA